MRTAMQIAPSHNALTTSRGWALAPMLSGARARGFADGLEWLGFAAALIDDRGEALHLNAGAIELMGQSLFLEGGRIRAADPDLNASIADAILETLMTGATTELVIDGPRTFAMRIYAIDSAEQDECQLLRAVAIFEPLGRA